MEKKTVRIERINDLFVLVQLLGTAIIMRFLPDSLPMHFNYSGMADRYGSKYELFVFAGISLLMTVIYKVISRIYKRKSEEQEGREKSTYGTNRFAVVLCSLLLTVIMFGIETVMAVTVIKSDGIYNENVISELIVIVVNVGLGLLLVLLGNIMPKTHINGAFGVRTGWSSYNDETWARSNRIGGRISVICGILCMAIGVFADRQTATFLILAVIILMAVIVTIVSYVVYSDVKEKEEIGR